MLIVFKGFGDASFDARAVGGGAVWGGARRADFAGGGAGGDRDWASG